MSCSELSSHTEVVVEAAITLDVVALTIQGVLVKEEVIIMSYKANKEILIATNLETVFKLLWLIISSSNNTEMSKKGKIEWLLDTRS